MLFTADAWPGIADGSIDITFRTWSRPQAKVGGHYRVGGMLIEATAVAEVDVAAITEQEAHRAGAPSRHDLLRRLKRHDGTVWRVDFRHIGQDDRITRRNDAALSHDDLAALRARLDRLDHAGAWTRTTLRLIEKYPGVVSTVLARHAKQERPAFKVNVRKLKELGLTESLDIGYRLSPRGEELLRRL
jgi:hypothetical protein